MARRKNSVVDGMLLFFLSNDIYLFQFYLYMFIVYFRSRVFIHNHSTLDKKKTGLVSYRTFPAKSLNLCQHANRTNHPVIERGFGIS